MSVDIRVGDCREILKALGDGSVQCCVTSPPYFGLRDYGVAGQIGLEQTPDAYVAELVAVFRDVRRVLADDGTLWLNIGDAFANDHKWGGATGGKHVKALHGSQIGRAKRSTGLPAKSLMMLPARVALALQADGWIVRCDVIWNKPSVMPEAVTDRPTRSHEYLYLLSKSSRYFYDAAAIAEACDPEQYEHNLRYAKEYAAHTAGASGRQPGNNNNVGIHARAAKLTRNKRSVWTVSTTPYDGAHFATFPPKLIEPCILAGSRPGDTVLDPFGGAGTTGLVASRHSRNALLIELNPAYAEMARRRIFDDAPLFGGAA